MHESRHVVEMPKIHALQRRHFLLFDVIPLLIVAATPFYWSSLYRGLPELALLFVMWLLTGFGITVGYHRLFTHRSFAASKSVQTVLAVLASMAGQGGVVSWVAIHRLHHEKSDGAGDLHSPNLHGEGFLNKARGLLHSHFLWMGKHPYPNVARYAPDILRAHHLAAVNRRYMWIAAAGLALPAAVGYGIHGDLRGAVSGLYWGGILRLLILEHIIWSINSVLHVCGDRAYQTKENSHNMGALGLLTLGESWHNNHHRFANSPNFGLRWRNLDPGYWVIRALAACGLASDLRLPDADQIAQGSPGS
ncbi:MAG: acyl-CoA desaturase [Ramlibacter sp.]|nr:acyl-CoA desaturase [Ramlibacter sp.]